MLISQMIGRNEGRLADLPIAVKLSLELKSLGGQWKSLTTTVQTTYRELTHSPGLVVDKARAGNALEIGDLEIWDSSCASSHYRDLEVEAALEQIYRGQPVAAFFNPLDLKFSGYKELRVGSHNVLVRQLNDNFFRYAIIPPELILEISAGKP